MRVRVLIEGLIASVFQKKEFSLQGKNGKSLNLEGKCKRISYVLEINIDRKLGLLRKAGNSSNHYDDKKEWYFYVTEVISRERAEQYIKHLEEVIIYVFKKFRL